MSSGRIETQQAILEAALNLFTEQGAASVRMADIAKMAGITRQAVYLHFGSRRNLLVSVVQYVDEKEGLVELARPIWEAKTGVEALDLFASLQAEYTPRIYPVAQALMSNRHADEAIAAAWNNRMLDRHDACRGLVQRLQNDRTLNPVWDIDEAIDALWAMTSIQVWEQLVLDRGWSKERYEDHLRLILRRTLVRNGEDVENG